MALLHSLVDSLRIKIGVTKGKVLHKDTMLHPIAWQQLYISKVTLTMLRWLLAMIL